MDLNGANMTERVSGSRHHQLRGYRQSWCMRPSLGAGWSVAPTQRKDWSSAAAAHQTLETVWVAGPLAELSQHRSAVPRQQSQKSFLSSSSTAP